MVRAQGPTAEIRAGRDPHARAVCKLNALDRPLRPTRDPFFPLSAGEPRQRRRLGEGGPGTEDRQGADEERLLTGHLRDRVRVEFESVFEGVNAGVDPDPCPDEETGMRGDLRTATMREFNDGPHVFRRPRRLLFLWSVEVELEEVRPVIELRRCGFQEGRAGVRFDREATREDAAVADPRSRDADPRPIEVRLPPFSYAERERSPPPVAGIDGERRTDVPGPPHARAAQEIAVVLCDLEQFLRRIGAAIDPVRTSGKG